MGNTTLFVQDCNSICNVHSFSVCVLHKSTEELFLVEERVFMFIFQFNAEAIEEEELYLYVVGG